MFVPTRFIFYFCKLNPTLSSRFSLPKCVGANCKIFYIVRVPIDYKGERTPSPINRHDEGGRSGRGNQEKLAKKGVRCQTLHLFSAYVVVEIDQSFREKRVRETLVSARLGIKLFIESIKLSSGHGGDSAFCLVHACARFLATAYAYKRKSSLRYRSPFATVRKKIMGVKTLVSTFRAKCNQNVFLYAENWRRSHPVSCLYEGLFILWPEI